MSWIEAVISKYPAGEIARYIGGFLVPVKESCSPELRLPGLQDHVFATLTPWLMLCHSGLMAKVVVSFTP
jgi:hypothetical protein